MRRLVWILTLLCCSLSVYSAGFDKLFRDSTLRVDIKIMPKSNGYSVCIDSIAQWTGWYGRRVNMDKEPHPEAIRISVLDAASNDTLYVDSKCPEAFGEMDIHKDMRATFIVPKPINDCVIKVTLYHQSLTGRKEMQAVSRHLYADELQSMTSANTEPLHPYQTIRAAANPKNSVNLAILAEGYTVDQMDDFIEHAIRLDSALFCQPGFRDCTDTFNVVAVMLPSEESGITIPSADVIINSALKSHFDSYGLERLVTLPDSRLIWDAIECIPATWVLILANTEKYGGSGSYNEYAIASAGLPTFAEILIHEFGHSFGWLGDEYDGGGYMSYPPDIEPLEPNITTLHDFSNKWQELIDSGEASLYEGAGYQEKGVWRGCEHCLMRAIEDHTFCAVCARAITNTINYLTSPTDDK